MRRGRRFGPGALGAAAFAVALVATLATLSDYGIASDVGNYFTASLAHLEWMRRLLEGIVAGRLEALAPEAVLESWRFSLHRIPHPPLSREIGALSFWLFGSWLEPLTAYRVGTAVVYAALVGLCGDWTYRRTGSPVAGIAAAGSALAVPALFAYGHLALTDIHLAAAWLAAGWALDRHLEEGEGRRRGWLWASGAFLGAACAIKFSGLLLGPVLLTWLWARRDRRIGRAARPAAALLAAGAIVFFAVNPVLWVAPVQGLTDYLAAGFGRADLESAQLTTEYLGGRYVYRPPWHYPFVWTAVVLPIPVLLGALAGAASWRRSRLVRFAALNLAVLYGVLLLPRTPLHDGVRLFLPALPFLCILAGVGAARVAGLAADRLESAGWGSRDLAAALVLLLLLAPPAWRTLEYHPYQLSYFNALIGGVRGAEARGLEVTSMKEVLTPPALRELSEAIPGDAVVNPGFLLEEMCFYRAAGYAPEGWTLEAPLRRMDLERPWTWTCAGPASFVATSRPGAPRPPGYIVVLNRKGMHTPLERALTRFGGAPFYEVSVEGVPLLRVYRTDGAPSLSRGSGGDDGGAPTPRRPAAPPEPTGGGET